VLVVFFILVRVPGVPVCFRQQWWLLIGFFCLVGFAWIIRWLSRDGRACLLSWSQRRCSVVSGDALVVLSGPDESRSSIGSSTSLRPLAIFMDSGECVKFRCLGLICLPGWLGFDCAEFGFGVFASLILVGALSHWVAILRTDRVWFGVIFCLAWRSTFWYALYSGSHRVDVASCLAAFHRHVGALLMLWRYTELLVPCISFVVGLFAVIARLMPSLDLSHSVLYITSCGVAGAGSYLLGVCCVSRAILLLDTSPAVVGFLQHNLFFELFRHHALCRRLSAWSVSWGHLFFLFSAVLFYSVCVFAVDPSRLFVFCCRQV